MQLVQPSRTLRSDPAASIFSWDTAASGKWMIGGLDYRLDMRAKSLWTGLDDCSLLILQCSQCSRNEKQQRCCEDGDWLVETGLWKEQKLPLCFLHQWLCGSLKFISVAPGSLSSLKLKTIFMPLRYKRLLVKLWPAFREKKFYIICQSL